MASPFPPRHRSISGRVRDTLTAGSKPQVDIELDSDRRPNQSYIFSYSTRDKIEGKVYVTAPTDTKIDEIQINLIGSIKTWVEKIGTAATINGRTEAFRLLLRLTQPIPDSQYPPNGIAEANKTYEFPFTFVVPDRLPDGTCSHPVANTQVRDFHHELPPSLGDPSLSGQGSTLLDDMAPDMIKISYAITAHIYKPRVQYSRRDVLTAKSKKIRVIPAYAEQPPLTVDDIHGEYSMRKEKSISKGLFKGKLGQIVFEAAQPPSYMVPAPSNENAHVGVLPKVEDETNAATTMTNVMLRFEPENADTPPPKLSSLNAKLRVTTYYASAPRHAIPTKANIIHDPSQASHIEMLQLSQRGMSGVQWVKHEPGSALYSSSSLLRRGSAMSTNSLTGASISSASEKWNESDRKPFYTATLAVPISLPKNKSFVPTFHACMASRTYILVLALSIPSPGKGIGTSLQLKVPFQVSSATNATASSSTFNSHTVPASVRLDGIEDDDQLAALAALADADHGDDATTVDDFFSPRSVGPPSPEYEPRSPVSGRTWGFGRRVSLPQGSAPLQTESAGGAPPGYSVAARSGRVSVAG